ncbi:hypothetical protein AB0L25_02450 [Spirillospora sp. NPDC052242]
MNDRSADGGRAESEEPFGAVPSPRRRAAGAVLLVCAVLCAVRSADALAGGDRRTVVAAAGFAVSLLLGGLALNGWRVRLCVRAAWLVPATLMFTGLAMLLDTDYGSPGNSGMAGVDSVLLGIVLLAASLAGCVLYGRALARLHGSSGESGQSGESGHVRPAAWKRVFGAVSLLCAFGFAVQFVDAVADGDWRRLAAAAGYGTALLMAGSALNGRQVELALRLMWLFPATLSVLGMYLLVEPDQGDPGWYEGGPADWAATQFGVAMMVVGVLGSVAYAYGMRRHLARDR